MGFIVKVGGTSLGVETVKTVDFEVDTPMDSNAKTTDMGVTMTITGKVLTILDDGTEETVDLALWSMVPAEKADCYRTVTVDVVSAGQVVRNYELKNAFVVEYDEVYGDTEGVGTFKLVVRQKKDKLKDVTINGGYSN
ncbi:MAG: membrane-associated protease 1 [Lachnospiraceae bacterium]|nr:membrane-associated protease 1 [Lachnospiraceae bacterium]